MRAAASYGDSGHLNPGIRRRPGLPSPLGATWNGDGVNFALFSEHATGVELCLFEASGRKELLRLPLTECTDHVWHVFLPDIIPGQKYGYRVHGPYEPEQGHRFNPHKLLLTLIVILHPKTSVALIKAQAQPLLLQRIAVKLSQHRQQ